MKKLILLQVLFLSIFAWGNSPQAPALDDSNVFNHFTSSAKEEGVVINWSLNYDYIPYFQENNYSLSLRYMTALQKEQMDHGMSGIKWNEIHDIDIQTTEIELKDLEGDEKYIYQVGVDNHKEVIWSKKAKFKTERGWGLFKALILIGALGMFIYGMKTMSEGLQQAAGDRLRNMLGSITSNRVKGVLTGFGITSIVQSSSVTTVMTVSFVNAGLLTLRQSAGVMMGANIGTTITAWLILIFGFKVSLSSYALVFIAFGAPMIFFGRNKVKFWGAAIVGFALLFMGLGDLKHNVPSLSADSAIVQFFTDFKDVWYGPFMFVILGALVTVIIQSSSAAMALTMTMVASGVIPFEVASAMILGENIGTTITAELASIVGNVHAKRSARIHSLFNLVGVTWAIIAFPFIIKAITHFLPGDPSTDMESANLGLAIFHTSFNTLNVLLLLGFVPKLVDLAEKTVKSKGVSDEEFHLDYIGEGVMVTPDLSILEARKEVAKFGDISSRMCRFTRDLLKEQNTKKKAKLHGKIKKYEEITDRVEVEVTKYLAKVSEGEMTGKTSMRIFGMVSIVNDLERIGDVFYQISKTLERKDEQKLYFLPEQRNSLIEMCALLDEAFEVMVNNLNSDWDKVDMEAAIDVENRINAKRDELRREHFDFISQEESKVESGIIFNNLFSLFERIGDHIINVTEAVTGEV